MSYEKNLRIPLLAVTLSCALLVLGKVIFNPTSSCNLVNSFVFPVTVPLPGGQFLSSDVLGARTDKQPNYLAGRRYQYLYAGVPLTIEMRYLNNTSGEIKDLLESYTSIPSSPQLRHQDKIGFYGLFTYQRKAYLSSCINSNGGSTVTQRQFNRNRHTYDNQINRILPWLLGQQKLEDKRCLWTVISMPIKSPSPDAHRALEKAWFAWYQWWYPRFPQL